jgi:hypothetical protein
MSGTTCSLPKCPRARSRGSRLCGKHLRQMRRRRALGTSQARDSSSGRGGAHLSVGGPGRKRVVFSTFPTRGRVIHDPNLSLSYWLRARLHRPPRADCIVYDGSGTPIAVMDGETRKRTPLSGA